MRRLILLVVCAMGALVLVAPGVASANSCWINSDDAYTNSGKVTVSYLALGYDQYRISNSSYFGSAPWYIMGVIHSFPWQLDSWEGTNSVYMQFRDGPTGSPSLTCSDSIVLDATPPTTSADVPIGWPKTALVPLSARDFSSGVDYSEYYVDSGSWTRYSTYGSGISLGPVSTQTTYTIYLRSWDRAGNLEAAKSVMVTLAGSATPTPTPTATATTTPTPTPTPTATTPAVTTLTAKVAPTTIALGRRVKVSGTAGPVPALASAKLALRVERKVGTRWVKMKTATATISATGTYAWNYKPLKKGAHRVTMSIAANTAHTAKKLVKTFKVR